MEHHGTCGDGIAQDTKSSTEPVSQCGFVSQHQQKTEQNHAKPILYTGFIQRSLMKMLSHLKKYQVDSPGTFKQ
jgi:hypothetical protein